MNEICKMLKVEVDQIDLLINVVDNVVEKVANPDSVDQKSKEPTKKPAGYESPGYGQPETPTEVENVYFWQVGLCWSQVCWSKCRSFDRFGRFYDYVIVSYKYIFF